MEDHLDVMFRTNPSYSFTNSFDIGNGCCHFCSLSMFFFTSPLVSILMMEEFMPQEGQSINIHFKHQAQVFE